MVQRPQVWKVRLGTGVPESLLEEEIGSLRDLPYSVWRDVIDAPRKKTRSANGRAFVVSLAASWAGPHSGDIRVTVAARPRGWTFHPTLRRSFIITPDSHLFE